MMFCEGKKRSGTSCRGRRDRESEREERDVAEEGTEEVPKEAAATRELKDGSKGGSLQERKKEEMQVRLRGV